MTSPDMYPYDTTPEQTEVIGLVHQAYIMHVVSTAREPEVAYLSRAAFRRFPCPKSPIPEIQLYGLLCRVMDRLPGISAVIFATPEK